MGMPLLLGKMVFYWEFHPYTNISQKRGRVTPGWEFDPVRSGAGVRGFLKTESEEKKNCVGAQRSKMPGIEKANHRICWRGEKSVFKPGVCMQYERGRQPGLKGQA